MASRSRLRNPTSKAWRPPAAASALLADNRPLEAEPADRTLDASEVSDVVVSVVVTAVTPLAFTATVARVAAVVPALNGMSAYSLAAVPPVTHAVVPAMTATPPTASDVGVHAVVTVALVIVSVNDVVTRPVVVALTTTVPATVPAVTCVCAWPELSVTALLGESVAEPLAT